ncbi:hypothetical protein PAMP_007779 [Pampus punctatissimus]
MDKVEEMLSPAEEEDKEEEEEEGEEDEGGEDDDDDDDDDDVEDEDGDDEEKESRESKETEEGAPQAADETKKKPPLPVQPKDKKQAEVLNLNNEVVKMRKEVKRVRALTCRKLTRQIAALKKKKGKETEIERNQRRAARLLEEIHAMKVLSLDLVTKTALQKNLNFEQVCKNPKSTISDRAVARIATHPQFNKKIEDIKAAVKAFKEERMNEIKGGREGERKRKVQNQDENVTVHSPVKGERKEEEEEEDSAVEQKEIADNGEGDGPLTNTEDATIAKPEKNPGKATPSADTADDQKKKMLETKSVQPASAKNSQVKEGVKNKTQCQAAEKKAEVLQTKKDEEESDLELSDDEEKEYFDDSTEERFHKQSSQSEQSDSDDDFFVGKVSKFKKNKKKSVEVEKKKHDVKELKASDEVQSELDELESRLKSKKNTLQSVFCPSLSGSKFGGGRGAGRGGNNFRGQKSSGLNRDFSKQSKFQKQDLGSKPCPEGGRSESEERGFASAGRGRGRGRGRGDGTWQRDRRGGGVFSQPAPQQALHPSWEASKKRKEQQGQILAFQGKKIKFDDDD